MTEKYNIWQIEVWKFQDKEKNSNESDYLNQVKLCKEWYSIVWKISWIYCEEIHQKQLIFER